MWAMGTDYVYERGGMALQNCGYTDVDLLSRDAAWAMDALMCGVGVGFGTKELPPFYQPLMEHARTYVVPDSREGWVESVRQLIESYEGPNRQGVVFDYSQVRAAGEPIKGFGGTASGPDPLIKLHERIRGYLSSGQNSTRIITDVNNAIGACVVAGNVRRSAEIALGSITDDAFLDLKNYGKWQTPEEKEQGTYNTSGEGELIEKGPSYDRLDIGWMSNNSLVLATEDDFKRLPEVAEAIRMNGEPGIMNLMNIQKYGRMGEKMFDPATGCNPCAEQPLENKEVCCLVEVFPTRNNMTGADGYSEFYGTLQLAQLYAHTVSLLPTHDDETNAVVARNHRIGESLSGIADWFDTAGASPIISLMNYGYDVVRDCNRRLAKEAGVPESIRVTTVKPSGTVSLLANVSAGMHYPPHRRSIRRIRFAEDSPICEVLAQSGIPYEADVMSDNTLVFEFPFEAQARRSQSDLPMHQKGDMVKLLQKFWSDNMVSNTLTFNPKTEGHQIEDFLAMTIPFVKTLSLLPDRPKTYPQMPYEGITKAEYDRRVKDLKPIDWSTFGGSDGQDSRFCGNDSCEI